MKEAGKRLLEAPRLLTGRGRVLPSFIIIGAQRAGTTSLYEYLIQQPSVLAARQKEVHFFDNNHGRGLSWYRANFPTTEEMASSGAITGEATPYYLFHPLVAARVAKALPDVRLVILLRNPVERAYSHHQHETRLGEETLSFAEALAAEPERLAGEREKLSADPGYTSFNFQHYSYLARGEYASQLELWFARFPRDQLLILNSAAFYADPESAVRQTAEFLKMPHLERREYRKYNEGNYTEMDSSIRARLVDRFKPHNERLYSLLGVDYNWA